jgi:hypothetical protein
MACAFSRDGKTLMTCEVDCDVRFWSVAAGQEMLLLNDVFPLPPGLMFNFQDKRWVGQAELNPVPDMLVWQELGDPTQGLRDRTRVVSLPTLREIDRTREEQRLADAQRDAAATRKLPAR